MKSLGTFLNSVAKVLLKIILLPRTASRKLHEAIEDWTEMAPYHIRLMAGSFNSNTIVGLPRTNGNNMPHSGWRDDFTRREMLIWHFLSYDRMMFGKKHPLVARHWINLGDLHFENGSPGQACSYFVRGLRLLEDNCPAEDPRDFYAKRLREARTKVADCYILFGNYAEAEVLLGKILQAEDQEHIEADLWKLNSVLDAQQKRQEMVETLSRLVDHHELKGLPASADAINAYRALSAAYKDLGRLSDSEAMLQTAQKIELLDILQRALGKESMSLSPTLQELTVLFTKRGKLDIASQLIERMKICRLADIAKGPDFPGIERHLEELADLYEKRDEPADRTLAFHLRARVKRIAERRGSRRF